FSSRRRHTRCLSDWSSDVCSSDLSLANDAKRLSALRDQLEHGLLNRVPHSRINGARAVRTPNTANLVFPGVEGEALLIALDLKRSEERRVGTECWSGLTPYT